MFEKGPDAAARANVAKRTAMYSFIAPVGRTDRFADLIFELYQSYLSLMSHVYLDWVSAIDVMFCYILPGVRFANPVWLYDINYVSRVKDRPGQGFDLRLILGG